LFSMQGKERERVPTPKPSPGQNEAEALFFFRQQRIRPPPFLEVLTILSIEPPLLPSPTPNFLLPLQLNSQNMTPSSVQHLPRSSILSRPLFFRAKQHLIPLSIFSLAQTWSSDPSSTLSRRTMTSYESTEKSILTSNSQPSLDSSVRPMDLLLSSKTSKG